MSDTISIIPLFVVSALSALAVVSIIKAYLLRRDLDSLLGRRAVTDHRQCVSQVARGTRRQHEAQCLRAAADEYDTARGRLRLSKVMKQYRPGGEGPSIPALWMRDRADDIDLDVQDG